MARRSKDVNQSRRLLSLAALKAHLEGLPEATPIEIWFEDEARIGQKNGQVRQWARGGTRPRQPADQRYDNAYLFGAICPARGVGAALALPYADADMMQLHLDQISRNVGPGHPRRGSPRELGQLLFRAREVFLNASTILSSCAG